MRTQSLIFLFSLIFSFHPCDAQMNDRSSGLPNSGTDSEQFARDEFLVNVRVFEFDSKLIDEWIEGITHLRTFGVDFRKGKGSDGLYQYVDEERMNDLIAFCQEKDLKVIWTLNVSSFTLEQEMNYVADIISKGLPIVGFQYGGEFWLKKYIFNQQDKKGVVERIRMDGEYRDYLNLLDMWLPPMMDKYPVDKYEHILVTGAVSKKRDKTQNYRREFNQKVFDYVANNPKYKGKLDFSFHQYAGYFPAHYNMSEEEAITLPEDVDWDFIKKIPEGSRWVVTESGYFTKQWSDDQFAEARKFYTTQSNMLGPDALMGVHVLLIPDRGNNPLALYNLNGITPVGRNIDYWLRNAPRPGESMPEEAGETTPETSNSQRNSGNPPSSGVSNNQPVLVSISPEYEGGFHWIHFSHTLTFSNGKSYNRSYWFGSPDFTKDDIGKPLNYFKQKVKNQ